MTNEPYTLRFSRQAQKDEERLSAAGLSQKARRLLCVVKVNPFQRQPPYEKLAGDLAGYYSRRINAQHRLVYAVDEKRRLISVLRMYGHYE